MAMPRVLCIVLAGGRGSRLGPLTTGRAKPSLTVGGNSVKIDQEGVIEPVQKVTLRAESPGLDGCASSKRSLLFISSSLTKPNSQLAQRPGPAHSLLDV